ncbi:MAG: biotin/lipoate A/B protein ligase family protein [Hyphomicrobiaceae bacterium]|nr:lipoate--protein ligase family protein [Hyphomicrobiaceae bacterium]
MTATPVPFRVIDTGVRDGRQQIAFDQALIDLHREGAVPDTVRYLRFPPTVLIGRHQAMSDEARVEHCRKTGVGLVRRITGGGAIYLEENQVGWELVLSRKRLPMPTLADYTRAICEAAAYGLSQAFGIDARYRPRNDIEVAGQKICGTGGFFDGDTLIYQGTVLIDVDPARMMACLNVPEAKLKKRDLDKAENRVTTLKALLGRAPSVAEVNAAVLRGFEEKLGIKGTPGAITEREEETAIKLHDEEIGTDAFVYSIDNPRGADVYEAALTGAGGTIAAFIRLEGAAATRRLREVLLTGDFFVTPPRFVLDLEATLRGTLLADIDAAVDNYFAANKPDLLTIAPADFKRVITDAVAAARS